MNTLKTILVVATFFVAFSCATIPSESVDIMTQIESQGKSMHEVNLLLLNQMFDEKKAKIDDFIKDQYTPTLIKNVMTGLESQVNFSNVDADSLASLMSEAMTRALPIIEKRKNAMKSELDAQQAKLVNKMTEDFNTYLQATASVKGLLISAAKLNKERQAAFAKLSELSKGKIDLNKVESQLDDYVEKAGDASVNLQNEANSLSQGIESIIKKL